MHSYRNLRVPKNGGRRRDRRDNTGFTVSMDSGQALDSASLCPAPLWEPSPPQPPLSGAHTLAKATPSCYKWGREAAMVEILVFGMAGLVLAVSISQVVLLIWDYVERRK